MESKCICDTCPVHKTCPHGNETYNCTICSPVPERVYEHLEKYFKHEAIGKILNKRSMIFGGNTPIEFVRQSLGTWDDVITKYDNLFSYQSTK